MRIKSDRWRDAGWKFDQDALDSWMLFPVVGVGNAFYVCHATTSSTEGRYSLNGAVVAAQDVVAIYLLLRIVLQDALSDVMKVYPILKLKVFVDDATAFMDGRNKELAGIAERIMKSRRTEMKKQCN